jgi:hypothetical protein
MNYIYEAPKAFSSEFCDGVICSRKLLSVYPFEDVKYWDNDPKHDWILKNAESKFTNVSEKFFIENFTK